MLKSSNGAIPSSCEKSKLLSICITGRDDDYMLDFKYRITTTLNFIARNVGRLRRLDDVEVLVTDWGSETPMARSLPLTPEAAEICRFVYVPPAVIRSVQKDANAFHVSLAMNAGLRRACGEFVLMSAADTLIPQHSLDSLLRLLEGKQGLPIDVKKTYFVLRRYQVQSSFVEQRPDLDEWDRYLLLNSSGLKSEDAALFGISKGAGALMMSRSLWYELGGLDERLDGWGWSDIELGLRVSQRHPWIELSSVGVWLLHMEHLADGRRASMIQHKQNPPVYNSSFRANDARWGLGDYDLEIVRSRNTRAPEDSVEPCSPRVPLQGEQNKPWKLSRQEVLAEMCSAKVRDHVKRVVELAHKANWKPGREDVEPLFFLSWYALHCCVRRYMSFGLTQGYAAAAVAASCPSVEIYAVDRWEGVLSGNAPKSIAATLRKLGHQGYLRFVNGDIATAAERLGDSFIGSFSLDLVLVWGDLFFGVDNLDLIAGILPHVSGGGALILTCKSPERFHSLWAQARALFPHLTYFCGCNTGLILAANLCDEEGKSTADERLSFDTSWVRRSRLKCLAARAYRALKRPRGYPEYARRAYHWISAKGNLRQSATPILPR